MSRKIIYLINPISGTRGKRSLQELIRQRTTARNIDFEIQPTNAEGDYTALRSLVDRGGVTDVVICGGDGTVNTVGAALQGSSVRVGIIPMGSGNGLAFAARIPKDPAKALEIIFDGKADLIDAMTINGRFSCMLCGIGFDAKVAHQFAMQPKRGLQTYVRMIFSNFFSTGFYPFDIRIGQEGMIRLDAFFISIANANQFGNNFTIAPRASLSDGLLDVVIVKKMNKLRLFLAVIRQVRGGYNLQQQAVDITGRNILYFQVPALRVENKKEAPLHIDGEPVDTAPVFDIRIVPKVFRLIQP